MMEIYSLPIRKKSKHSKFIALLSSFIVYSIIGIILCCGVISLAGQGIIHQWDYESDVAAKKLMRYHGVDKIRIVDGSTFYIWRDDRWIKVKAR